MSVWIAQILCPDRHCILASAFDDREITRATAETQLIVAVENMVTSNTIGRACCICGSEAWHIESGRSRYATMDQARPDLERLERENAATRRFFMAVQGVGK